MPDLLIDFNEFETLAASILQKGQSLRFRALGGSMRPFINNGDIVEVQPAADPIRRGDVVFCRLQNNRLVVHRVVQIRLGKWLIQGDALPYSDGYIPRENILGRVNTIYRQGRPIDLNSAWMKSLAIGWHYQKRLLHAPARAAGRMCRQLKGQKLTPASILAALFNV